MQCVKCRGQMLEDRVYDLPKNLREYCCMNCGQRLWFTIMVPNWEQKLYKVYDN